MTSMQQEAGSAGAAANDHIIATAVALKAVHGTSTPMLCEWLHISSRTWHSRIKGATPFLASEVAELARFWGVRISDFYEGRLMLPDHRGGKGPNEDGQSTSQSTNA